MRPRTCEGPRSNATADDARLAAGASRSLTAAACPLRPGWRIRASDGVPASMADAGPDPALSGVRTGEAIVAGELLRRGEQCDVLTIRLAATHGLSFRGVPVRAREWAGLAQPYALRSPVIPGGLASASGGCSPAWPNPGWVTGRWRRESSLAGWSPANTSGLNGGMDWARENESASPRRQSELAGMTHGIRPGAESVPLRRTRGWNRWRPRRRNGRAGEARAPYPAAPWRPSGGREARQGGA